MRLAWRLLRPPAEQSTAPSGLVDVFLGFDVAPGSDEKRSSSIAVSRLQPFWMFERPDLSFFRLKLSPPSGGDSDRQRRPALPWPNRRPVCSPPSGSAGGNVPPPRTRSPPPWRRAPYAPSLRQDRRD